MESTLPKQTHDQHLMLLLRGVARSFYLTLRVLPIAVRESIAIAYLLARAADTIADTEVNAPEQRLNDLLRFRQPVAEPLIVDDLSALIQSLIQQKMHSNERQLLMNLPDVFSAYQALSQFDHDQVKQVVLTLIEGMEIDLRTFLPNQTQSPRVIALSDAQDLDRYTYFVAGCVGEFWTKMMVTHIPALSTWSLEHYCDLGVQFGKALQMTNILRDVPQDLRIGRCYLPEQVLQQYHLTPSLLLEPTNTTASRQLLSSQLSIALAHYQAAQAYLFAIPRRCFRLRMATFWPIIIGLATLVLVARNSQWLDPMAQSKVSRRWIYGMMLVSIPIITSNTLLKWWFQRYKKQITETKFT